MTLTENKSDYLNIDYVIDPSSDYLDLNYIKNWKCKAPISNEGLSVVWKNLTVVAEQKKSSVFKRAETTYKEIIHNVSGAVEAGRLVAILGGSGSGKSTLMSVLANRNPGGLHVDGDIRIGGKPIGDFVKYVSGFVYQDDLFISSLTVLEHLTFTAKLRLDKEMSEKARRILIFDILSELGLLKIAHSRIGGSTLGKEKLNLSGGERKRLSIATELLTDPALLFCDEPTTGLDSFTALKVISSLERLVTQRQKTILCSIHQPNQETFNLFHQIILLSNGKLVFSGTSNDAMDFFMRLGYPLTEHENPADYLVKSLGKISDNKENIQRLYSEFESTTYYSQMTKYINVETEHDILTNSLEANKFKQNEPCWCKKLWYITHRTCLSVTRGSTIQLMQIIEKILLGVMLGLCLKGTFYSSQDGIRALEGLLYVLVSQNFFPAIHAAMDHIPKQLPIFYREYANSTNTPVIFYLANMFSLLPGFIIDPVIYILATYFLAGLKASFSALSTTCIISIILLNTSAAFGSFMSVIFNKRDIAVECSTPIDSTFMFCCGVFIKLSSLPFYLRWIRYICWFTYAFEALLIVQVEGMHYIRCPRNADVPCLRTGYEVLTSLDFNPNNLWPNMIKMGIIYLCLHFAAYLILLFKVRSRKV